MGCLTEGEISVLLTFFTKQATLMGRSTVLSLPPQLVFPGGGSNVALSWFRQGRRKLSSKLLSKNVGGRHHQKLTLFACLQFYHT